MTWFIIRSLIPTNFYYDIHPLFFLKSQPSTLETKDWMSNGAFRESNSGPLAPKARIIPLDQMPGCVFVFSIIGVKQYEVAGYYFRFDYLTCLPPCWLFLIWCESIWILRCTFKISKSYLKINWKSAVICWLIYYLGF